MIDDQARAIRLAWEQHRIIATKLEWLCSCGEGGAVWPKASPYATGPGAHLRQKADEILEDILRGNSHG